jgi:hypothetical protein
MNIKECIVTALYWYQNNADAEEQIEFLQEFGCKNPAMYHNADKRATLFELAIKDCINEVSC